MTRCTNGTSNSASLPRNRGESGPTSPAPMFARWHGSTPTTRSAERRTCGSYCRGSLLKPPADDAMRPTSPPPSLKPPSLKTHPMPHGKSLPEALAGAFAMKVAVLTPFLRRRRTTWGSTPEELQRDWPGDDLVPTPSWQATMAITVNAPPERVWPWVAQIGQGRGGFHSYEKLENLAGCQIKNATRVIEDLQGIAVGDEVRLHPKGPPLAVVTVERNRALVLYGGPPPSSTRTDAPEIDIATSWAILLEPDGGGATRLISRTRYRYGKGFKNALAGGPALLEPISSVMTKKMLGVIKGLVEEGGR